MVVPYGIYKLLYRMSKKRQLSYFVIGNVMAENIVFGSGVIAHHPEELF